MSAGYAERPMQRLARQSLEERMREIRKIIVEAWGFMQLGGHVPSVERFGHRRRPEESDDAIVLRLQRFYNRRPRPWRAACSTGRAHRRKRAIQRWRPAS